MDQSLSDSDVSLSPSIILERLQILRKLQILQRGKLQKQRIQFQESFEQSSSATEAVSQFSKSPTYNAFRNLLQSSYQNNKVSSCDLSPRTIITENSQRISENDLVEGVSILNLSQEGEINTVSSEINKNDTSEKYNCPKLDSQSALLSNNIMSPLYSKESYTSNKPISVEELPISTSKSDFETLVQEKLQHNEAAKDCSVNKAKQSIKPKKPFLKKGEGLTRFGIEKNKPIIQNTKSLPWKKKTLPTKAKQKIDKAEEQLSIAQSQSSLRIDKNINLVSKNMKEKENHEDYENVHLPDCVHDKEIVVGDLETAKKNDHGPDKITLQLPKNKHPLLQNIGTTWASVLTKDQSDFLMKLKQSDYYKTFASPAKSSTSDISHTDSCLSYHKESVEQRMFELLENKVCNESFSLENSFFNKFLQKSNLGCSGESTPLIMKDCLMKHPSLMQIFPEVASQSKIESTNMDVEICNCENTDCCSDVCSTVSTCCDCKKEDEVKKNTSSHHVVKDKHPGQNKNELSNLQQNETCHDDSKLSNGNETLKANMVEMNSKLIATSELLKERLHELEDEIEIFKKENSNLAKLREEIEIERQKFYEEKSTFEKKFNEEKILAEYYLAEEKEKLTKQKQTYEKYVREMRGRLSKRDKDEVANLKKQVNDLKEEIKLKDAKSSSTVARLRNHIKIVEKEKKDLQNEVEKLKKENRRIQHSNEVTRRLTNIKYLEEINKKLSNIALKEKSEVDLDKDVKYKAFEIERQSRSRKVDSLQKNTVRPRAKSVPNLKVTSRYAKYFSQKDICSDKDSITNLGRKSTDSPDYTSDNDNENFNISKTSEKTDSDDDMLLNDKNSTDNEDNNNVQKNYMRRFLSESPKQHYRKTHVNTESNTVQDDDFFFHNSSSDMKISPPHSNFSKTSRLTLHSINKASQNSRRSKSPLLSDILSNHSSEKLTNEHSSNNSSNSIRRPNSGINSPDCSVRNISPHLLIGESIENRSLDLTPETSKSKVSYTRTNLNPTEIRNLDNSRELKFPNGNKKYISADGQYSKFIYYNGDIKENFLNEGRVKYFYAETKTYHTTHADGLEVLEFPDGQVEKRYQDGSTEIRLPNGSVRYQDPKNEHVREEWRFPDGAVLTVSSSGEQRIVFANGQVEVHAKDHKRREYPDGTVKLIYNDGTSETRYSSGRVRIKDKHGNLIMDSAAT